MGEHTDIAWCDATFNCWWGCTKIAGPGGTRSACDHCYAEAFASRYGHDVWGKDADRRFFGDNHWAQPAKWNAKAAAEGTRLRVFCTSMGDVFEDRRDLDESRQRLFRLIEDTPNLDWLLLTKRPEQMNRLAPVAWADGWPVNVWAGCTVEDQGRANLRVPRLLEVPVHIRFLSCEPLLGPITLIPWARPGLTDIHWCICGGESGAHRQELNLGHAHNLQAECAAAGVAFFMKQDSHQYPGRRGRIPDDLWVQQFPTSVARPVMPMISREV